MGRGYDYRPKGRPRIARDGVEPGDGEEVSVFYFDVWMAY